MTASKTLALTEKLIALSSVTPDDKGCQQHLIDLLSPLGFVCEMIQSNDVTNLWARRARLAPCSCLPAIRMWCRPVPRTMALGAVHSHPPRRQAVWSWRGRHEDLDRGHGGGLRGIHRRQARARAVRSLS